MGFVFGLIGAFAGSFAMSAGRGFFGAVAGLIVGWLLHRLLTAQGSIRQLQKRLAALEQQKPAEKSLDSPPARVSVYEPAPVAAPKLAPAPATASSPSREPDVPPARTRRHRPNPAWARMRSKSRSAG